MNIRIATKQDIDQVFRLYLQGFKIHYEKGTEEFKNKNKERIKQDLIDMIDNPNEIIFVIEDNSIIIGYALIKIEQRLSKIIWIDEIVIDEEHRKKGNGRKLINKIYEFAKENDCKKVELNCWSFNEDAIKFYEKMGFIDKRIIYEKDLK